MRAAPVSPRPPNGGASRGAHAAHTARVTAIGLQKLHPEEPRCNGIPGLAGRVHGMFAILIACSASGCSGSPSRNILGSYFPSWMLCALAGLIIALAARAGLRTIGLLQELPAPPAVLLAIGCASTFALWLVWLA